MYEDILDARVNLQRKLYNKVAEVERAKLSNAQRNKLLVKKRDLDLACEMMSKYLEDTKLLLAAIDTEDRAFKNRRLDFIDALVSDSLTQIFPQEELQAKLVCDFNRKNEAVLELRDKNGNIYEPDICSGKLQQYLISFAAVVGIVRGLGINSLFIDEAFGAAAVEILGDLGEMLKKQIDDGVQIILVAQNPGLYQDLPRHELQLIKNPTTKSVSVLSEMDY